MILNVDEVILQIRRAANIEDAAVRLQKHFDCSAIEVKAILQTKLSVLAIEHPRLDTEKIVQSYISSLKYKNKQLYKKLFPDMTWADSADEREHTLLLVIKKTIRSHDAILAAIISKK